MLSLENGEEQIFSCVCSYSLTCSIRFDRAPTKRRAPNSAPRQHDEAIQREGLWGTGVDSTDHRRERDCQPYSVLEGQDGLPGS